MAKCGTGRREQNEPTVAIDPHLPSVVAAGANDYCTTVTTGETWLGYYRSTDGGGSWQDSILPGDPSDDSADGRSSPTRGRCSSGSDPSMSFDPVGRLFYGFICFQRLGRLGEKGTANSSTFVATYDQDGSRYVRTALVGKGSRSADEDKINLAVDQTNGRYSGNVYTAWVEIAPPTPGGFPQDLLRFARSTDHGRTFSAPRPLSPLSPPHRLRRPMSRNPSSSSSATRTVKSRSSGMSPKIASGTTSTTVLGPCSMPPAYR